MTGPAIREAARADAAAMARVIEAAYRGEGGWTTEAHLVGGSRTSVADVEEYITDPHRAVLVAEAPAPAAGAGPVADGSSRVIGCCCVHLPEPGSDDLPEFGLFAVDPRAQSGGIGRALADAAEDRARAAGCTELMIQVLQTRPELRDWYIRRGFAATGEVLAFPGTGLKVDGLGMDVMVKPLV